MMGVAGLVLRAFERDERRVELFVERRVVERQ